MWVSPAALEINSSLSEFLKMLLGCIFHVPMILSSGANGSTIQVSCIKPPLKYVVLNVYGSTNALLPTLIMWAGLIRDHYGNFIKKRLLQILVCRSF